MTRSARSARALDALVGLYQRLTSGRLPRCRFFPSCSQYAREAIAAHGAATGSWLALRRLGRCHPFGGHGFDPVPEAPLVRRFHRDHLHSQRSHSERSHPLRGADPC